MSAKGDIARGGRILVVDDDPDVLRTLEAALSSRDTGS